MKFLVLVISLLMNTSILVASEKVHDHKNEKSNEHKHGDGHKHKEGDGHAHENHSINKDKTLKIGKYHISRLVKKEKIDKSWLKANYIDSVKKKFGKQNEWVLSFNNKKGIKGKTLFIFLNLSGEFIAANFTGK